MIDYTNCDIERVSIHQLGNKTNGEELRLSNNVTDTSDLRVEELLFKFFLTPFAEPEFYIFSYTNGDFNLNPIYKFACEVFETPKSLHKVSVNIAKHLYELSTHPQIKSGDLFVAYFTNVLIDGATVDALGIFKSENRQSFLKLDTADKDFSIEYDSGINIDKLDKGCLIYNVAKDYGLKVAIIDRSNKATEAQFWKESFLQLSPYNDDFHHTKEVMLLTKSFVTNRLTNEFEITKADQIDLLNRSVDYFKSTDTFDKKEFEKSVFQNNEMIKSFRNFDKEYQDINGIEIDETFEVSQQAVKKQSRFFKSVLKLDKNFHVYIHGDKNLIEKGFDAKTGLNFYKIYFTEER